MQHRQAADARVEHADRPLVHLRDCRERGRRLPSAAVLRRPFSSRSRPSRSPRPAAAFSKEDGMQTMDDGVPIASTRYTPDGAAPAGGLAGRARPARPRRGTEARSTTIAATFANAGYSVLAYDARGHGDLRRRDHARRAARDRRPARASQRVCARGPRSATRVGAWGISYGGGQIWNALAAGVPFAAAEVVETWTSLYDALWPQDLARSGIVAGFAASIAARSPLVAGIRDDAVQSTQPRRRPHARAAALRGRRGIGSITTPVYLFQGRVDFAFDITQAAQALREPRRAEEALHRQLRPRAVDLPGRGRARTCSRRRSPGSTAT